MIRTAVVLAAGRGKRLAPLTDHVPKALIEVAGTPLIDHSIGSLVSAGVERVCVVVGHLADDVRRHLASTCAIPFETVEQPDLLGTGDALRRSREWVQEEPFVLTWGDVITAPVDYATVVGGHRSESAATVGVIEVEDVSTGAAVVVSADMRVERIVEKPADPPPSHLNNAGLMVLGPGIWPEVDRLEPSIRGELELTDAISSLISGRRAVYAVRLTGPWFDVGTIERLRAARATYTDGR